MACHHRERRSPKALIGAIPSPEDWERLVELKDRYDSEKTSWASSATYLCLFGGTLAAVPQCSRSGYRRTRLPRIRLLRCS
jgi:hypothetical protein